LQNARRFTENLNPPKKVSHENRDFHGFFYALVQNLPKLRAVSCESLDVQQAKGVTRHEK